MTSIVPIDRYLAKDETLQVRTGPHWVVFLRWIVGAAVILVFATGLTVTAFESTSVKAPIYAALAAGAVAVAFGVLTSALLKRHSQVVLVTNNRIVEVSGVLHHSSTETRLSAVQSISIDQSVAGRLLNFGTVTLHTANQQPMVLKNIAFPLELHQAWNDHKTYRDDIAAGA